MKQFSFTFMACILLSMFGFGVFAQNNTLVVDNQTPGWLSSKIDYANQISVQNLKVTGYINTDDISFLEQLSTNRSLTVLDLEDVHMVPGGTAKVGYSKNSIIKGDDEISSGVYSALELRKLITSKNAKVAGTGLMYYIDTLVVKFVNNSITVSQRAARVIVSIPEGTKELNFPFSDEMRCSVIIPSTISKITNGIFKNFNIMSFVENPEDISFVKGQDYYDMQFKGDTLWIPQGTKEKYLNTRFKTMKVIIEMTPPSQLSLDKHTLSLYNGDNATLNAKLFPSDCFYKELVWKSLDDEISRVDSKGQVTAVGYGKTQIIVCSAKDVSIADTCNVEVFEHTTAMSISDNNKEINIGESFELSASTLPLGVTDNRFIWSSSNENIASVDQNGKVTGLNLGTCIITATAMDGGSKSECVVTVLQPAKNLTLNKHLSNIKVNEWDELLASISPTTTSDKSIFWISRNVSIADVSNTGIVTGKKAGKVYIVAQAISNPEAKDSCEVTVLQPVTGIEIDKSSILFTYLGESIQLSANILPDDASDKGVKWFSSNLSVCSVSESGVVVATGSGSAVVTATSVDGGFVAVCVVTVNCNDGIKGIEINSETEDKLIYDAFGKRQKSINRGLNLIRMSDGTIKKVMVK